MNKQVVDSVWKRLDPYSANQSRNVSQGNSEDGGDGGNDNMSNPGSPMRKAIGYNQLRLKENRSQPAMHFDSSLKNELGLKKKVKTSLPMQPDQLPIPEDDLSRIDESP